MKKTANKRFWLKIPVMTLVFGMAFVTYAGADTSLNGTWVDEDDVEMIFNNGRFEMSEGIRGTYKTSGRNLTMQITHVHGENFGSEIGVSLESKWYSKRDLSAAIKKELKNNFLDEESIDEFEEIFNMLFSSQTWIYSLSGNFLTLIFDDGSTEKFTRKK